MGIADIGGSMVIHMFGAFFGLTVSAFTSVSKCKGHKRAESNYISDLTSLLGSVFLWMYWPSFNGALQYENSEAMNRAFTNTILSLSGSVFAAFTCSIMFRSGEFKINVIDIQNASLAGGVAMGTCADMHILPIYAILIGIFAGCVSTLGFSRFMFIIENKLQLHDSCGVLNLHGIPGLLGAIWGCIAAGTSQNQNDSIAQLQMVYIKAGESDWNQQKQGHIQVIYLFITLSIAIGSGIIAGIFLKLFGNIPTKFYEDGEMFHMPHIIYEDMEKLPTCNCK
ncbi:rh50 glycoprotein, putative [Ichthyophthirius multifiliis]|uniref:Rh50 glycoprotein, putative n=1 Tax=Ichthyophthirius multifiliis TaxID=5932 RepID=G0R0M2_ICHMU|nr:rh50 glycoprotein, putative [Ichthyophthirius multifiliis]EGR28966.1 rh50 glycoprotein, putative [Ichthyophthirius multifiliis]|eukprot:XP_004030202.1 rh50 glycoprotein, putative [Ichthyophthirius multifiliis]